MSTVKKQKKSFQEIFREWIWPFSAVVTLLVILTAMGVTFSCQSGTIASQKKQIAALENRIEVLDREKALQTDRVYAGTTGMDSRRVAKDDGRIKDLMETAFDWDSYSEYMEARKKLQEDYGIAPDSSFMTVFMPALQQYEVDGKTTDIIKEDGLNLEYEGMTSRVMSIDSADNYRYFSIVTIKSHDKKNGEATGNVLLMYTVSPDGNISNVQAYTLTD